MVDVLKQETNYPRRPRDSQALSESTTARKITPRIARISNSLTLIPAGRQQHTSVLSASNKERKHGDDDDFTSVPWGALAMNDDSHQSNAEQGFGDGRTRLLAFVDACQRAALLIPAFPLPVGIDAVRAALAFIPRDLTPPEASIVRIVLLELTCVLATIAPSPTVRTALLRIVSTETDGTRVAACIEQNLNMISNALVAVPPAAPITIRRVLDLLRTEYSTPQLGLPRAAREAGLSKCYLCRLFRRTVGEGFTQHLHRIRSEAAASLLTATDRSIKQIAYEVGYLGSRELDRHFKRSFGVTPSRYRTARNGIGEPIPVLK